jgi:hypothetical protein
MTILGAPQSKATGPHVGGLAILAVGQLSIQKEARAVDDLAPFNIEWIQFLIPGNFTLSGSEQKTESVSVSDLADKAPIEGIASLVPIWCVAPQS